MLPASYRLRDSNEFGAVVRRGIRIGRPTLVAHVLPSTSGQRATKVGFVVSKAIGNSVHRNLVKRRLRGAMWEVLRPDGDAGRMQRQLAGAVEVKEVVDERSEEHERSEKHSVVGSVLVVVRALPPAATASFAELQHDLNCALGSAALKVQGWK